MTDLHSAHAPELAALPTSMSLHLAEDTAPSEIAKAKASGFVHAVKR